MPSDPVARFVRPHVLSMAAYEPILPFEVVSARLGREPSTIVKLDANENPKMIFQQEVGGKPRFFRRMPEIGTKDVMSFSPFPVMTASTDSCDLMMFSARARRTPATAATPAGSRRVTVCTRCLRSEKVAKVVR